MCVPCRMNGLLLYKRLSPLFLLTEPDQLLLYIQQQRKCHGGSREMPDARMPAVFPHLPVRDLCLQPGRSHGSDSLCHHPNQVSLWFYFIL